MKKRLTADCSIRQKGQVLPPRPCFVHFPDEPRAWWFEIFETFRRICLTGLVYFAAATTSQLWMAMLITVVRRVTACCSSTDSSSGVTTAEHVQARRLWPCAGRIDQGLIRRQGRMFSVLITRHINQPDANCGSAALQWTPFPSPAMLRLSWPAGQPGDERCL